MIDYILKNNFVVKKGDEPFCLENFFYFRKSEKGVIFNKPATMLIYMNPHTKKQSANIHFLNWEKDGLEKTNVVKIQRDNVYRFGKYVFGTLDPMEISVQMPRLFAEMRMLGFTSRLKFSQSLGFD